MYTINKVYVHTSFISSDHRNIIRESITPLSRYTSTRIRLRAVASKKENNIQSTFRQSFTFFPSLVIRQICRATFLNNIFYLDNSPIPNKKEINSLAGKLVQLPRNPFRSDIN